MEEQLKVSDVNKRLVSTAMRSSCRFRVAAIGLNHRGKVIASACNAPRFNRRGGGIHAEAAVMKKSPMSLRTILLCRVGARGDLLPIDPCDACNDMARKRRVRITTVPGARRIVYPLSAFDPVGTHDR